VRGIQHPHREGHPLKAYTEFIIRLADLVEAEGRSLRGTIRTEARSLRMGAVKVGLFVGLIAAAAPLCLTGVGLVLLAAYLWMAPELGPPGAALITGLLTLAVAGGLLWGSRRAVR
jgi:hypothetical protein